MGPHLDGYWEIASLESGYCLTKDDDPSCVLQLSADCLISAPAGNVTSSYTWNFERIIDPPEGLLIYTNSTGQLYTSIANFYTSVGETVNISQLGLEFSTYSEIYNPSVTYQENSQYIELAANGNIYAEKEGIAAVYVWFGSAHKTMYVRISPFQDEDFYIKNAATEEYIVPGAMVDGCANVSYATGIVQRIKGWNLLQNDHGYYTVQNAENGLYLTLRTDGTQMYLTAEPEIVPASDDGTEAYCQQWAIRSTPSEKYKVYSRAFGGCYLIRSGNQLVAGEYTEDTEYSDEWIFTERHVFTIQPYYDYAFEARYADAEGLIEDLADSVAYVYGHLFEIEIECADPQLYESITDKCKQSNSIDGGPVDYTSEIICNGQCGYCPTSALEDRCTSWKRAFDEFFQSHDGSRNCVEILFTGHILLVEEDKKLNRSFVRHNDNYTRLAMSMQAREYGLDEEDYFQECMGTFFHEMAHVLGAPDHYHDGPVDENGKCEHYPICSGCGTDEEKRPDNCLMRESGHKQVVNMFENDEQIFCQGCEQDIRTHITLWKQENNQ